jgi:hypothetical protein
VQYRRVLIAAKRANEPGMNLRVSFEMVRNAGAVLDLAKEIVKRCRPEPMKVLDETSAPCNHDRVMVLLSARFQSHGALPQLGGTQSAQHAGRRLLKIRGLLDF